MTAAASNPVHRTDPWSALAAEFDLWAAEGKAARFWWRDDDLERPGPKLDRLLALHPAAPKALAVIPATAAPGLAPRLDSSGSVTVIQHGWRHANHAPAGEKKSEFGDHRPVAVMLAELRQGRDRLEALFGARFRAVLAPPWNRFAPTLAAAARDAGYWAISGYGSHGGGNLDTHIDPIDWRGGGFVGEAAALAMTCDTLRQRREAGEHDIAIGLLTHHRVMDECGWMFVDQLVAVLQNHPGAMLATIDDLIPAAAESGPVRKPSPKP
jgi:peptidoglycan/xylan/chitin deacetylase (PgdA/CDA1 family)